MNNPYLDEVKLNLPRLLSLIDRDITSDSFGMADRYYWAWGLIDFGNGSFQGISHGFSMLWKNNLWPYDTTQKQFINRIDSLFIGAKKLTKKDGSLEEAFPNEGSFCVTALVSFDLLRTIDLLEDIIDQNLKSKWMHIVEPMIMFLIKSDETHGIISNHLATASSSLFRWHHLTNDAKAETRALELLKRILQYQSKEGWFKEYNGADPGYQSLCIYYMADIHIQRPDLELLKALRKSIQFLWHFAHPDGSFGGIYGSRCTRFYYPAGILALSDQITEASVLCSYMLDSIKKKRVITLSSIDEPNLTPTFNAYCWSAVLAQKKISKNIDINTLPAFRDISFREYFSEAGLLIDKGEDYYSIIATGKGGVTYHFKKNKPVIINSGAIVKNRKGILGSNQTSGQVVFNDKQDLLTIISPILPMPKKLPKPWQFLILRLFSLTIFRSIRFREKVKQMLVKKLIKGTNNWPLKNVREIKLGRELSISDSLEDKKGYELLTKIKFFIPIHMASQGYWQIQDEEE